MKEKTKELADSVGAVYPTLFLGRKGATMTDLRQAAQMALEALEGELLKMLDKPEDEQYRVRYAYLLTVITALRTALAAQPQQEHVAWRFKDPKDGHWLYTTHITDLSKKYWRLKNELFEPLYTAPPQENT